MASVWLHSKTRAPEKMCGGMSAQSAKRKFESLLREWRLNKGSIKRADELEALLFDEDGKLAGGIYIELMSPPSAPEPGQPRRTATA